MVDFVEEVEDELRAERLAKFARTYLPWFGALLGATVVGWLGVWGYDSWTHRNIDAASLKYDKAINALVAGDQVTANGELTGLASDGPSGYRYLALMEQGNLRLASGAADQAGALFDHAAQIAPNAILGDLARLRAAHAVMDTAPYAQIETRLKPLIGDKKPYTIEARETLAMAKLQAGMCQQARGDFGALVLTLGVSQATRGRAQGAMSLIDSGQCALVGQVVKAAATLPPSAPATLQSLLGAGSPEPTEAAAPQTNDAGNPQ